MKEVRRIPNRQPERSLKAANRHERVVSVDDTNDAVMVHTSVRLLAFRSQTTEWVEVKYGSTERKPSTSYIRSSSSSMTSAQVETAGRAPTGTPRLAAISCRRP